MIDRQTIVDALAAVEGVTASSTRPATPAAGMAWPAWASTTWLNMRADGPRERRWFVFVVLSGTVADATVAEADPLVELVGQALADAQLRVVLAEPVGLQIANQNDAVPALRFTLAD